MEIMREQWNATGVEEDHEGMVKTGWDDGDWEGRMGMRRVHGYMWTRQQRPGEDGGDQKGTRPPRR